MPDVGFRLFGDSTAFERSVARSKGAVDSLGKEVSGLNKIMGTIGKAAGAFGVVEVFSRAINKAQALRDELEKNNQTVGAGTAALANYGDALDSLKKTASDVAIEVAGQVPRFGEYIGRNISIAGKTLRNIANGNVRNSVRDAFVETQDNEESEEGARLADARIANQKVLEKMRRANLSDEEKLTGLAKDALKLEGEYARLDEKNIARAQYELRLGENKIQQDELRLRIQKRTDEEAKRAADEEDRRREKRKADDSKAAADLERKKAQRATASQNVQGAQAALSSAKQDSSKLSLSELAAISPFAPGVSHDVSDAGAKAREVKELEAKASRERAWGNSKSAEDLMEQAREKRKGLGTFLNTADSDPLASLEQAVTTAQGEAEEAGVFDAPRRLGNGVPVGGWKDAGVRNYGGDMRSAINASGPAGGGGSGAGGGGVQGAGGKGDPKLGDIHKTLQSIDKKFGGVAHGPSGSGNGQ